MAKRKYQMTEERITKLSAEGRGKGVGAQYSPWLTMHDVSSTGRSHRVRGAKAGRVHHFLSDIELAAFLECDWHPAVFDVREQFPLDREATRSLAAAMGVRHPQDHGVDIVMTTDLLVDIRAGQGARQAAVAVKPSGELGKARTIEKLEIERRYWSSRGVPWHIVTEREVSKARVMTLQWLHEWRWLDSIDQPYPGYWEDRCAGLAAALAGARHGTAGEFLSGLERSRGWEPGDALSAVRHLAANRRIGIDVDKAFEWDGPVSQLTLPIGPAVRLGEAA